MTTPEQYAQLTAEVIAKKQAWRDHAQSLSWEEKIASIVRMQERAEAMRRWRSQNEPSPTKAT